MSHQKLKDLSVPIEDAEGNTKYWKKVGVLLKASTGREYLLLDRCFNPAGVPNPEHQSAVKIFMFEPKVSAPDEEDIPF